MFGMNNSVYGRIPDPPYYGNDDDELSDEEIEEIMSKYKYGKWIPVDEMLPLKDGCYFVAWRNNNLSSWMSEKRKCLMEIVEWSDGEWVDDIPQAGKDGYTIFAWMPLPDFYYAED